MKFGLIYEIESVKPWPPDHESRIFWETLEQVELADRLGLDSVWCVEHHFLSEFSYSSAPEVFLACASQRTERIRLGHGVVLLPFPFNHPIRVAERVATLDIMSRGRVDLGTGRGTTREELEAFGVPPEESRPRWEEALRMLPGMWCEDPFSFEGTYFHIPPRSIIPKPVQKPHPPLWVAASSPATFGTAGRMGLGVLGFTPGLELTEVAQRVRLYREALDRASPVGRFVNPQVALMLMLYVAPTDAEAVREARESVLWYVRRGFEIVSSMAHARDAESYGYLRDLERFHPSMVDDRYFDFLRRNDLIAVGSPATCRSVIERHREVGADHVLFFCQFGRLSHARILDSLRLLAADVLGPLRAG
jgi:alkanesulfonate monooxygenase SsuD/methylene tetrahydromethanopterin reductase-like flavin-dependent oxidoreductase (luciferase family)